MRVLVAPQEFKGTLTAKEAAQALSRGLAAARPDWDLEVVPVADGGPGTLDALAAAGAVTLREAEVEDPLGRPVRATFGLTRSGAAVVEMAQASGLWRVARNERDALFASTYGTGQLIRAALDAGAEVVDVTVGGSATTDGGAGALQALGARLWDSSGAKVGRGGGGAQADVARIDLGGLDPRVKTMRVWVDVQSPLLGPTGAAHLFAPQKGASVAQVEQLEAALARWAEALEDVTERTCQSVPGAGAAGGLAFGLCAAFGARLVPGFEQVSEVLGLPSRVRASALVVTGEGRLDAQSSLGKGPSALAALARAAGVRVVCFAGAVAPGADVRVFDEVLEVSPSGPPAIEDAGRVLEEAARRFATRPVTRA